ncbi:MAG: threonine--tRNA ligase [Lentisphaerae bacterium]|nr:threonine--tRNA ligase [Lentisphaerota bacterium]
MFRRRLALDLEKVRHSAAHVLAAAVTRLFEDVQLDIGPATADGFYYDFDLPHRFTPEDFPRLEAEMARLVAANLPFERRELTRAEAARALQGQRYKLERLADIPAGEPVSFYRCGDFLDLCRGPHLARTGEIPVFKLISVAGAYYRGLETNPMLQRIYGIVAESAAALQAQLDRLEEAHKRDHRKLGRELDLFSQHDEVGAGLIHWHPKGARIRALIEDFWRREHWRRGYELLYTPHLGRAQLWATSGHLDFYRASMYAPMKIDECEYFLKPMNCPFHIQVYKSQLRSYRDLPLRWAELGTVYRYEKAGVLHGLLRVRGFTQDDAHIFCTSAQIEEEVQRAISFALALFKVFGFVEVSAYLSTRPAKAIGEEERWTQATASLAQALERARIPHQVDDGGGAFYGPKVDLKIKDAIGREWQLSTIQFDFNMPERFDVTYVGEDGRAHRPYMVHRALLGSLERFFGIIIEHYGGAFPLWLAPEQVRVLPLTDKQVETARQVTETLLAADLRVTLDAGAGKLGAKIRNAQLEKIPYMLVIGPKEAEANTVAVRSRAAGDQGTSSVADFVDRVKAEVVLGNVPHDAGHQPFPPKAESAYVGNH